jgi:hypothetical protein
MNIQRSPASAVFFRPAGADVVQPLPHAASNWADGTRMRGMASSALLARAAEQAVARLGRTDLRPGRWTADLSRPVGMGPTRVEARVRRHGRRICLVDSVLLQNGEERAWARGTFVTGAEPAAGNVWTPEHDFDPPPEGLASGAVDVRQFWSEGVGWTSLAADHGSAGRRAVWQGSFGVVEGEEPTPFQFLAGAADVASVTTQWGDNGVRHINADLSLNLVRAPKELSAGFLALDRIEDGGVSVGTTWVRDGSGVLGTCTVTALANGADAVNPADRDG